MGFDFWVAEWPLITAAPHIVIGGAAILAAGILWFVNWLYSQRIANKDSEISALRTQLEAARTDERPVSERIAKLETEFQTFHQQILAGGDARALAGTSASIVSNVLDLSKANNRLTHTLAVSPMAVYTVTTKEPSPTEK